MRASLLVSCCLVAASGGLVRAAEQPAAPPNPITVQVVGLFCPEREAVLRDVFQQIPGVTLSSLNYQTAEAVVAYDRPELFPQSNLKSPLKPEQLFERLNNVVRQTSNGAFSVKPQSATPQDQLSKIEVSIGMLDCVACALGAYEIVMKVDGVERVTVMQHTGQITAWIDPAKTSQAAVETALKKREVRVLPKS